MKYCLERASWLSSNLYLRKYYLDAWKSFLEEKYLDRAGCVSSNLYLWKILPGQGELSAWQSLLEGISTWGNITSKGCAGCLTIPSWGKCYQGRVSWVSSNLYLRKILPGQGELGARQSLLEENITRAGWVGCLTISTWEKYYLDRVSWVPGTYLSPLAAVSDQSVRLCTRNPNPGNTGM
jgi:hypothetical protein